jgi:Clp amino terminal domain, pathogenicity island component/ClpX C4-type zinc finger
VFERFTDRARRVVVLAQEEARLLNHNYIGTEHLLLGLIHEGEGVAAKVLASLDVSLVAARAQVNEIIGHGGQAPSGHIPFTPRAKKVLELSLRESLQLGHDYIGTEHILLGLVREGEGVAAQVLGTFGLDLSRVRQAVIQLLSGYHETTEPVFSTSEITVEQEITFTGNEIRPATCAFCGAPSPQCGTLFVGDGGALICERCIRVAARVVRLSDMQHQPLGRESRPDDAETVEERAARIEPTGPPPNDEDAARDLVADVFQRRTETSANGEALVNVVGGENLGHCQREVVARFPGLTEQAATSVEHVKFVSDHEAIVLSRVIMNGHRLPRLQDTRVVLTEAGWKVTRESMCEAFARAGVHCPPPEPPATPPAAA